MLKRGIIVFVLTVLLTVGVVFVVQYELPQKTWGFLSGAFEMIVGSGHGGDSNELEQRVYSDEISGDLADLAEVEPNFGAYSTHLAELAREKGGVHVFEILKRADFSDNIDLHLLGHVVGDELYKQTGFAGMQYCTHHIRNACSHSIVIGALLEEGPVVFDAVNEVCAQAPGGPGAYTMCFHGFGHGVLAYAEYEMEDAVDLCRRVGTEEYNEREYVECVGGAVMEMNGGVHDPEVWAQKAEKYLRDDNPIALCQAEFMPERVQPICYTYVTPFLFKAAGEVGGRPTPEVFERAFQYCQEAEAGINRDTCYESFGKEFIVLVQGRDVRSVENTSNEQLTTVIEWCELTDDSRGQELCKDEVLDSLYWGGENHYDVSVRYCSLLSPQSFKDHCFNRLIQLTTYYHPDPQSNPADREYREGLCNAVPERYTEQCTQTLL